MFTIRRGGVEKKSTTKVKKICRKAGGKERRRDTRSFTRARRKKQNEQQNAISGERSDFAIARLFLLIRGYRPYRAKQTFGSSFRYSNTPNIEVEQIKREEEYKKGHHINVISPRAHPPPSSSMGTSLRYSYRGIYQPIVFSPGVA